MATTTITESYAATHKFARISARKARRVVDLIRGVPVEKALVDLRFCLRRASPMVSKVLRSAIANAEQAAGLEPNSLYVSKAIVDEGPTFKRWRPRAMGRAFPRTKRTSHIRVEVAEMPDDMRPRQKESKAGTAKEAAVAPTPTTEADPVPSEVAAPVDSAPSEVAAPVDSAPSEVTAPVDSAPSDDVAAPSDDGAAPSDDGEAQAENKQE